MRAVSIDSNSKLVAQHSAYIDKSMIESKQEDIRKVMKSRGGTRRKNIDMQAENGQKIEKPDVPKFANL